MKNKLFFAAGSAIIALAAFLSPESDRNEGKGSAQTAQPTTGKSEAIEGAGPSTHRPSLVSGEVLHGGSLRSGTSAGGPSNATIAMATNYIPTYQGGEFAQFVGVGTSPPNANGPDYDHQFIVDTFWIKNIEFNPATVATEEHEMYFGASFEIKDHAHRCAGDFILLGEDSSGQFFERWISISPKGARTAFRSIHSGPGLPPVLDPPTHSIVGGGGYVPLADRSFKATIRRARLPHSLTENITDFCIDPDGRYIFAVTDQNNIQRIDLVGTNVTTIATASQFTLGVHDITQIGLVATETFGRSLYLRAGYYGWSAYLQDQDNDGVFESVNETTSIGGAFDAMTGNVVARQDI